MLCMHEKGEKSKATGAIEKYSFNLIKNITLDKVKGETGDNRKKCEERLDEKTTSYFEW